MKYSLILCVMLITMISTNSLAADKNKLRTQIDSANAALEAFVLKTGEIRDGAKDLNQVRYHIKRASDVYEKGLQLFGFAGVKPEAEQEIGHYLTLAELSLEIASQRIDKGKTSQELEALEKALATVKSKIKVFEDRKSEIDKLKADAFKYQAVVKEMETLKTDNSRLAAETDRLRQELKKLSEQLAEARKNASIPKPEPKPEPKPAADPPKEAPADKK